MTPGWLSFAELDQRAGDFDARIAATTQIDHFCSCSDWIIPARIAFAPEADPLILATDQGYVALMSFPLSTGARAAVPLEASWGLACPLAGPEPEPLVAALLDALDDPAVTHQAPVLVLSGLAAGGRALQAAARQSRGRGLVRIGPAALRIVADLTGGVDGFYARRSAKFRATARRARRAAAASGVVYERMSSFPGDAAVATVWARVLDIERRCWKAAVDSGVDAGPMHVFYREMLPRVARRGALRVVFARRGADDLAYCFGGLFGTTYRGLQASFDHRFAAESPGVLVHLEMIELLAAEGILAYDLGSDMDYKRRWGEPGLETVSCLTIRAL